MKQFDPWGLYPFLWALVPLLYRVYRNPGYVTLSDVAVVSVATLTIVGVLYLMAVLLLGRRAEGRLSAACAFLGVLWFFGFDPVAGQLPNLPHHLSYVALALLGLVATMGLIVWLGHYPALLGKAAVFLTLSAALLVVRFAVAIPLAQAQSRETVERSQLARDLARPVPGPSMVAPPVRDVYLIVLDEYANQDVLQTVFGFDNTPFLDSLRALGFYIPDAVSSNYVHTTLSLPSLLNSAHVYPAERELSPGSSDPTLMNYLLARSRIALFLQSRGYRYVFFPSMWWGSTRSISMADSVVDVWSGFHLQRELSRTEFRRTIRRHTILDYLYRDEPADGYFVKRTLEAVGRLPATQEPIFAFVHVLSPHWPYVFDRSCRTPPRQGINRKKNYIDQLQCLNGLVLTTVGHLIRDSQVPPVILLQGDHGSLMSAHWIKSDASARVEDVPPSAAWERFGAFGAYYLPGGGAAQFGDSVTIVNVLGNVLRWYFGANLAHESDDRYLSVTAAPFRLHRVDAQWLAGGHLELPRNYH